MIRFTGAQDLCPAKRMVASRQAEQLDLAHMTPEKQKILDELASSAVCDCLRGPRKEGKMFSRQLVCGKAGVADDVEIGQV